MSDRTSIPMDREVFARLKAEKGDYETWNDYLLELAELAEKHHDPPTLGDDSDDGLPERTGGDSR